MSQRQFFRKTVFFIRDSCDFIPSRIIGLKTSYVLWIIFTFGLISGILDGETNFSNKILHFLHKTIPIGWTNKAWIVEITSDGFKPKEISIAEGDWVTFLNRDLNDHWPASNLHPTHEIYSGFDARKPLQSKEGWKFQFTKVGNWYFHDHLNPSLGGKIRVLSRRGGPSKEELGGRVSGRLYMERIEKTDSQKEQVDLMRELTYRVGPVVAIELLNESKLPRFGQTHLVSHVIGEVAYDIYKERAFSSCQGDMLNGCVHGLVLTAISDVGFEGVKRMVESCKKLTPFKYTMCLHASGHGFVAFYGYDLSKALASCEELTEPADPNLEHCYNGAFMENVHGDHGGLIPPRHPWLSKKDLLYPCNKVASKYRSACYLNQAGWWYQVLGRDLKQVVSRCSVVPQVYALECANNVGRIVSTAVKNDLERILSNCGVMVYPLNEECLKSIGQSVFALGDEELPFVLCRNIVSRSGKKSCYADLVSAFRGNSLDSDKSRELCLKFESGYQYLCNM